MKPTAAERPEILHDSTGPASIRIHGTTYPLAELVSATQQLRQLQSAAELALCVANAQRVLSRQLQRCEHPVAKRLLGHLEDAEAQAWAQLGALVSPDDAPRLPRMD